MPKCAPLGNPDMKAAALARRAGEKALPSGDRLRRRIKALQELGGYASRESFAAAIGIEPRRMTYIIDNPEAIKLNEAAAIQALAKQYDAHVFDMDLTVPT